MGTWGTGTFQNDDALDFLTELGGIESDWETLVRLCKDALRPEYLQASEAAQVLVAAELIAAGNGKPSSQLPEDAVVWLKGRKKPGPGVLKGAQVALDRILKPKSELLETWEKTDDFGSWKREVEILGGRLW